MTLEQDLAQLNAKLRRLAKSVCCLKQDEADETEIPDQATHAGEFLTTNGTDVSWTTNAGGDVTGGTTLGGGLDIFVDKVSPNLRFNSLNASDFNLASNLISIDYTNGQAASGSAKGFLTAADWTTFNNKGTVTSVAALTLGTTGTDLSSTVATSTTTPVITLNVPTASAANRGALSAADWTTFNNKGSFSLPALTAGSVLFSNGTTIAQDNANFFWDDSANTFRVNNPSTSSNVISASFRTSTGTSGFLFGNYGTNTQTGAIWSADVTPSTANFAMIANSVATWLNAPSGGTVNLAVNATVVGAITSTGLGITVTQTATANNQVLGLNVSGTITARGTTSDNIYGIQNSQVLVAAANSQKLVAVSLKPTFTYGAFTSLTTFPLEVYGQNAEGAMRVKTTAAGGSTVELGDWSNQGYGTTLNFLRPSGGTVATSMSQSNADFTFGNVTGNFVFSQPATISTSLTTPLLIGGSGTTQTLTYKTTTGVGATGADHIFQVGSNGATEAMRILNSGQVLVGGTVAGASTYFFQAGSGVTNATRMAWDNTYGLIINRNSLKIGATDGSPSGTNALTLSTNTGSGVASIQGWIEAGPTYYPLAIQPTGGVVILGAVTGGAGKLTIPVAPTATANYGTISLGSGPFDGATSGFFVGSASGTHFAINAASGYAGNFVDYQIAGVSAFKVTKDGDLTARIGSFTSTVRAAAMTAPDGSAAFTIASASGYINNTVKNTFAFTGIASNPAIVINGAWFTGGSATTTKPQLLIEPSGTTSTAWSTAGTGLGVNAASGFTGNLLDLQLNGATKTSVSSAGILTAVGLISNNYVNAATYVTSATSTVSGNGAVSAPIIQGTGTWYSGGSATTTKPYVLIEPSGTTSTGWSTSGTGLGVNAASGFVGTLAEFQVAGVTKFTIDYGGSITAASSIVAGAGAGISWNGRGVMLSPSNGVITLYNNGFTDFTRLQLGGTTSSFPSIKRNAAAIDIRLADDSAYANINAAWGTFSTNITLGNGNYLQFNGSSIITSSTDGIIRIMNSAANDFSRLQLGGTTSSYPSIKRSTTGVVIRLADDSADTDITAAKVISTNVVRLKGYTVATLPAGTQGDTAFVTDALAPTFLAVLVGGGSVVTPCFYNGSAWVGY